MTSIKFYAQVNPALNGWRHLYFAGPTRVISIGEPVTSSSG